MIHGAASGVGQQGVAARRRASGPRTVVAVVRRDRPDARGLLERLGADRVIAAGEEGRFAEAGRGDDRQGRRGPRR